MKLSVVIPVFNGADTIAALLKELHEKLAGIEFEVVLVNDGSRDRSEEVCAELAAAYDNVSFLSLRKNFGEHNAVMCGLNHTRGDYVAIIDDDFQNPPEEILVLVKEAEKGYDTVFARYEERQHAWWRNIGSNLTNYVATWLVRKPKDLYLASFKVIRREVVDEITKYKGPFPYVDGLIFRVTNNVSCALVHHQSRRAGRSNYTLRRLISLYLNMFLNFSILPLRFFTLIGAITFCLGLIYSIISIAERLLTNSVPSGWTTLIVSVLLLSGTQLLFMGLIGEYLGKHYLDYNGTPQWVVKRSVLKGKRSYTHAQ